MPELPAVEFNRCLLEEHVIGNIIRQVEVTPDDIVFAGSNPGDMEKQLIGCKPKSTGRYGKYLWLELQKSPSASPPTGEGKGTSQKVYMLMHFGMTGFIQVRGVGRLYYKSAPESISSEGIEEEWPPKFTKIRVEMDDGTSFVFGDARRLGRVSIINSDPMTCEPVSRLAHDPLLGMPKNQAEFQEYYERIIRKNVCMKALLLDQSFAAGVGNWMADDILLRARIHPEERSCNLSIKHVRALCEAMTFVAKTAVAVNADGSKFPKDWLFNYRWESDRKSRQRSGQGTSISIDGHPIKTIKSGGRTTLYVPDLQKLIESKLLGVLGDKSRSDKHATLKAEKRRRI